MAKVKLLVDTEAGLSDSERKKIVGLLSKIKVLKIDNDINKKYSSLIKKYSDRQELMADYIIAATAWAKNLPLLTRNLKHFEHIEEIKLSPVYEIELSY